MFNTLIVYPLLNLLMVVYGIIPGHDFGIAVILMTIIIRLALWPLAGKQLHSQKKMQELQPEIAKVRKAAAGDRQKESQLLMELYKEKEINPLSSCLPTLIQFPFLIALFFVLKLATQDFTVFSSHLYSFVAGLPHVKQLFADPTLFKPYLLGIVNLAKPSIVLAILAGISQYVQVKMITPKVEKSDDPQARMASSMTLIFPLLTGVIALSLPAALPLYWTTANLVSIFQQKLIMGEEVEKLEEEVEAEERAERRALPKPVRTSKSKPKKKSKKK